MNKDIKYNKNKFYVTTPIYYVTAKPHLGSLYSTVLADIASRFYKLKNYNTFFLTGTDEHGQKIAHAAEKANLTPQEFVDNLIPDYKKIWHNYNISYDIFARTTSKEHTAAVKLWIANLKKSGDIYKGTYTGYYCTPCETYVTDKDVQNDKANKSSILCPSCSRETKFISEESYFFKLSNYQDKLLKFYEENPDFIIPKERVQEVINFVKSGLKDLSISRTTVKWGIEFEEDREHVTYVWAEALNIYISAIGYGNPEKEAEFNYFWPADLQIIGKDILIFHAVYWPAFLMASGLKLPKHLLAHGWLIVNKQKMSKSFGNTVDPQEILNNYGSDAVRYYLARYMAITQDSEFSLQDLEQSINSDLCDSLGNLLNRMITLSHKNQVFKVKAPINWGIKEIELKDSFYTILSIVDQYMQNGHYYLAIANIFKFVHQVNSYFQAKEPWHVKDKVEFEQIISTTCHSLYAIAILLWPIMPQKMEQLLKTFAINLELDLDLISDLKNNQWNRDFVINKSEPLFKKIEKTTKENPEDNKANIAENNIDNIKIEDFNKAIILVGTIISCENIEKSDKLYKLQVDFGNYGIKQILSGIKKYYSKEELINQQNVFLYNLEPRKMFGFESCGMILVASTKQKPILTKPIEKVENGTKIG